MGAVALSRREREVAALASIGASNKLIARVLNVAEGTVKVHLHNIMRKLGVKNRTELVAVVLPNAPADQSRLDKAGRSDRAEAGLG